MKTLIPYIIAQLQDIQQGKIWIGSSYASKMKSIDDAAVFVRPINDIHSIAEIFSHVTLWRNEAILKIKTGKGSKTDDCEENWLSMETLKARGWTSIKAAYDQSLVDLIDLLQEKEDSFLEEEYYDTDFKGTFPYKFLINGMLHHDLYHLGQLGIIIKYLIKGK